MAAEDSLQKRLSEKLTLVKIPIVGVLLVVVFVAASWSLFRPGFFRVHDYVHAARIAEMGRALQDGHIPPRWSSNFGYGYGMPLFEFYAPLPYFVGALLYMAGLPVVIVIKLLFLFTTAFTIWGAYKLGKESFGETGGVLAATLLTLAPYRALNLFVRGALSETIALMTLPWILWATIRVLKGQNSAWLPLCLGLVVLLLSHNLTALMFAPFLVLFTLGYALIRSRDGAKKRQSVKQLFRQFLVLAGAATLAIGLSAFYTLPAFLEKGYTQLESLILSQYFDFHLHFLYIRQFFQPDWAYGGSVWGPDDDISFFLGWGQLLGLVFVGLAGVRYFQRAKTKKQLLSRLDQQSFKVVTFLSFLCVGGFFLTLSRALPVWEAIPLLEFLQFPWRFMTIGTVFLAFFVPAGMVLFPHRLQRWLAAGLIFVACLFNAGYFAPESYLENSDSLYYVDEARIRSQMSDILPDYISQTANVKALSARPASGLITACSGSECEKGIAIRLERVQEKLLETSFTEPTEVIFSITDFPGWLVEVDGEVIPHQVSGDGLIQLLVPAGEHKVGLRFGSTPIRRVSDTLSLISIFVLLFMLAPVRPQLSQKIKRGANK